LENLSESRWQISIEKIKWIKNGNKHWKDLVYQNHLYTLEKYSVSKSSISIKRKKSESEERINISHVECIIGQNKNYAGTVYEVNHTEINMCQGKEIKLLCTSVLKCHND
jgi:hypothetical protein